MKSRSLIEAAIVWEKDIKAGEIAIAKWTNCGNYYETEVEVIRVNVKSFAVMVKRSIGDYYIGHMLNIPRALDCKWSRWNRLFPIWRGGK